MNRNLMVLKIAGRYLGDNQEDEGLPWADYVADKTKKEENPGEHLLLDMVKHAPYAKNKTIDNEQLGKNLLDGVNDARSISHNQDVQPANNNDDLGEGAGNLMPAEFNWLNKKDLPDDSLRRFWNTKNRPDEATGNPWGSDLYGNDCPQSVTMASMSKTASKSLHEITIEGESPRARSTMDRGKLLIPKNITSDEDAKKGLYTFTVKSNEEHKVVIQFLKGTGKLSDHPCMIACDCKDFLFGGPQYYAVKGHYMYMPMFRPQLLEPRDKENGGKGKNLTFCEHLYSVVSHLSNLNIDDNYAEEMEQILPTINVDQYESLLSEVPTELKTKFIQFLETKGSGSDLMEKCISKLKEKGFGEYALSDFVKNQFSTSNRSWQRIYLNSLDDSPIVLICLLLEYRNVVGSIPKYLSDVAYKIITDIKEE